MPPTFYYVISLAFCQIDFKGKFFHEPITSRYLYSKRGRPGMPASFVILDIFVSKHGLFFITIGSYH